MTDRLGGYDLAKTFSILLLFPVHSFILASYPVVGDVMNYLFLGIFFYVSGFFACHELETKSSEEFLKNKIRKLYVPYAFFTVFYALCIPEFGTDLNGIVKLLLGLGLYRGSWIVGQYLWFVPCLLVYMAVLGLFHNKHACLMLWAAALYLQPWMDARIAIYFPVFLLGAYSSKTSLTNLAMIVGVAYLGAYCSMPPLPSLFQATLATILLVLPAVYVFSHVTMKIPLTETIAKSTLYIYLLEPCVGYVAGILLAGAWYVDVLPPLGLVMIALRVVFTVSLGIGIFKLVEKVKLRF